MGLFDTSKKQNQKEEVLALQRELRNTNALVRAFEQKVHTERAQSAKSAETTSQEINRLRNLLQTAQDERRRLQIDVTSFQGELQSTRLASERLIVDITTRDQQVQALKQSLSRISGAGLQEEGDYNVVAKAQSEEIRRLEDDLSHRERAVQDVLRRLRHATALREEAQEKIERQLEEINEKDHILDNIKGKLRDKELELNQRMVVVEESMRQLRAASKTREDTRVETDRQAEELEIKTQQIVSLRESLEDKEKLCREMRAELYQYQAQVDELENETSAMGELRRRLQQKEEECADKDAQLTHYETIAQELASKTEEIAHVREELRNALQESETKGALLVQQKEQSQEEKRRALLARQDVLKLQRENQQLQVQLEKMHVKMTEEQTRGENENAKLKAIQQRLADEEHRWEQGRRAYESELHQSRQKLRQTELLEVELVQKSAELHQRQTAIGELENAMQELMTLIENETREAGEQFTSLNTTIEAKTRELEAQTEASYETRLALNRARNELNNETRKARLAAQAQATTSRQMEYVQQQCAVLQEKLTDLQRGAEEQSNARERSGR
jgi:chromosome segregation ATPase